MGAVFGGGGGCLGLGEAAAAGGGCAGLGTDGAGPELGAVEAEGGEGAGEFEGAAEALFAIGGEHAAEEFGECFVGSENGWELPVSAEVPVAEIVEGGGLEEGLGGEGFGKDEAEGVDVGADVGELAAELFGAGVEGGTAEGFGRRVTGCLGEAEVHEAVAAEDVEADVAGGEIAVGDAVGFGMAEEAADLGGEVKGFGAGEGAVVLQKMVEVFAFDEGHQEEEEAFVIAGIEDGDGVGVVAEACGVGGFAAKAFDDFRAVCEFFVEDLGREQSAVVFVPELKEGGHAAEGNGVEHIEA